MAALRQLVRIVGAQEHLGEDETVAGPRMVNHPSASATGVWDDRKTPACRVFDTMIAREEAASDHAAIWGEIKV